MTEKTSKLIEKMAALQIKKNQATTDKEAIQANIDKLTLEIQELNQKIEESKKPKLRHGDYGVNFGCPWVMIGDKVWWCGKKEQQKTHAGLPDSSFAESRQGNLSDLKDMQEDVEWIELNFDESCKDKITIELLEDCIQFYDQTDDTVINIWLKDNPDFELKIRQMVATAKRRQK